MDHDNNLKQLTDRARQKNLKLNKDKLKLRQDNLADMGHVLSQN